MLARGELQTVGATTLDEYRKHLEKDAALERRFQPVKVDQPSVALTIDILKGLRTATSRTTRSPSPTRPSWRRQPGRPLPGDRFLPTRRSTSSTRQVAPAHPPHDHPPNYKKLEEEIGRLRSDKEAASTRRLRAGEEAGRAGKGASGPQGGPGGEWRAEGVDLFDVVDEEVIAEVLANWTGIPVYASPRRRRPSCCAWRTSCTSGHRPEEA